MPEQRRERADAVRNRRAILAATEHLLTRHRPNEITIEQVALAAGVGKGTVFHRFGSRMGLMLALMQERAKTLTEAVDTGPPPLGPGAPPRDRLLAFLSAVVDVVGRNKGLLAALGQAVSPRSPGEHRPVYAAWHQHISSLITAHRPDLDAPLLADLLLAGLHAEPILDLFGRRETARVKDALHVLADGILTGNGAGTT
ncbi:MAG: TetR/AcrR family transcriptional regulator [Kutzneria sp.]|nr:TetR/AcrR family transcriptional regulator [Kutzneria sp.]MBV9845472.1 TetR/AcrR family transcriptional regulator [Kutzneria sp.]